MKNLLFVLLVAISGTLFSQVTSIATQGGDIKLTPISHATMVWEWNDLTVFFDPTGGEEAFEGFRNPDVLFITDIHGDHLNLETLEMLDLSQTTIIAPEEVLKSLEDVTNGEAISMKNGMTISLRGMQIEAVPMYNLDKERQKFHPPGRGNGYVVDVAGTRIYVCGDTEDTPEMRQLRDIDVAFICMNLPYTMTEESAASAVLEFEPKMVFPYHYRGADNVMSDPEKFKEIVVRANPEIEVVLLNWYP